MTFETITLTFRQKVLLDRAIENEIANLRGDAKDLGLLTKELGDEYEDLLKLITACCSFRVEPPAPEELVDKEQIILEDNI